MHMNRGVSHCWEQNIFISRALTPRGRLVLRELPCKIVQRTRFFVKYVNMKGCWRTIVFLTVLTCGVLARNTDNFNYERENRRETGSMLAEIAKELVQRSTTSSQVLNLNLSNLLLLLVLKAVVFGAGYLGNHGHRGREINEENVVSEGEVALALGYLIGDTCLYRAACEVPNTAKDYLGAVEMIIQTMKLMPQSAQLDRGYEKTIMDFKKAIEYGMTSQCPPEYTCKKESIQNFLRPE